MKLLKSVPAALAAVGLIVAQPLAAQENVPVDEIGVPKAAQPLTWLFILVAIAVIAGLLFEDNDDVFPQSP
jgi:hypothetical protein